MIMAIRPTNRSAVVSGLLAGAALALIEAWSLPETMAVSLMVLFFFGSAFFFAIGHENIHIKTVWAWSDLTPGERQAFSVRVPLWFLSLAAAGLAVALVAQ